ncbi:MAG: sterol desaturase family protein [Flavobacteriales bacterium]
MSSGNFWIDLVLTALLSIIVLFLIFTPMELVFPANKQKIFRSHWLTDLWFFLGQYLLWSHLVFWVLFYFSLGLDQIIPSSFRNAVATQPFWLQCIEVIVLSDFMIYWAHRFQHHNNFLWRFHKIHHSAKHLDWLAAHREHPLDTIYTVAVINLPAFILGFPVSAISAFIVFRGLWAIYIHSNVRLNIGPLRWLIGSPELHHWHHDLERDRGNYANLSPLMDLIFGTHYCPNHEPEKFGIKEDLPENYIGQLREPFSGK